MESRKCLLLVLILFLLVILLISFATKGAHWDQISHKSGAEENFPEVYRSLEGLITLDVLLFILCLPIFICFHSKKTTILKYLLLLFFLILIIRFIISLIFLSGNDNYCSNLIQEYDNLPNNIKSRYGDNNFFTTLKAAWGFEIFTIIVATMVGCVMIVLCVKEIRGTTDLMRT